MPELLPCPFCGAPGAKLVPGGGYWKIKCDCGITVSGYATGKNAVAAWNRRPTLRTSDEKPAPRYWDVANKPDVGIVEFVPSNSPAKRIVMLENENQKLTSENAKCNDTLRVLRSIAETGEGELFKNGFPDALRIEKAIKSIHTALEKVSILLDDHLPYLNRQAMLAGDGDALDFREAILAWKNEYP